MHHLRSLKEIHCIAKGPGISKSDANIRILLLLATGLYRGSQKITDISQHKHLQYIVGKSLKLGNFGKFGVGTFTPSCLSPHLHSWRLKHPVEDIWVTSRILLIVTMNAKLQPHIYDRVETTRCDCFDSFGIKKSSNFLSKDIHHPNLLGVQHIPCKHEAISSVGNGWAGSNSRGLVPQKCDRSTRVPVTSCS